MKKWICIFLLLFTKTIFLGDTHNHIKRRSVSEIFLVKAHFVKPVVVFDGRQSDRAPSSVRKKKVRGIAFELVLEIPEIESEWIFSSVNLLPHCNPSILSNHSFCNGKRGPPSVVLFQ